MSCKSSQPADQYNGWKCNITGSTCLFLVPNSKACAEKYNEGPDADPGKCENCREFYLENNKRCCKLEPLALINGEIKKTRFIADDVVCCGAFS